MVDLVYEDIGEVLGKMRESLDDIELVLHDNQVLRHSVPEWDKPGRWRNGLFHQERSLKYMSKTLKAHLATSDNGNPPSSTVAVMKWSQNNGSEQRLQVLEDDL
ncbi:hypothetical protein DL771_010016 [Monosporascus sp. 5C6A]|nr:hypothetical protein DL771_010016 [Monosporascus sp. 5C6A]